MSEENFYKSASVVADGNILFTKYQSSKTGLTVCIAEVEGPLVSGFLLIPTEAHDDDGLPHTLEHLVFLGSEKYPYKGVLDSVANLCLADGTNAWTDTDHTCYLVSTAGADGFLNFLPIYVDHLLYPLLTDSAYTTEVHHVNAVGEDAGVVYMEMLAVENSMESISYEKMLEAMYPGVCGYKSNVGGRLKNLRESTTNTKVRDYHRKFYRPENLTIIIIGQIDANSVFQSLSSIEERILKDLPREKFEKPWQSPVPPLEESLTIPIECPCDEENFGDVLLAFRGPKIRDYNEVLAIGVLLTFMTETSVSLLKEEFIESSNPVCSDIIGSVIENSETCIHFTFKDVLLDKIESVKDRFMHLLVDVVEERRAFDMKVMKDVIENKKLKVLNALESKPHQHLAHRIIADILYSDSLDDLRMKLQHIPAFENFLTKGKEFWIELLKRYFVDGKYVCVICKPSKSLAKKMSDEEKQRVSFQKEKLGPDGLKQKEEILAKAIEANNALIPDDMFQPFSVPNTKSLKFHSIKRYNNYQKKDCSEGFDIQQFPFKFQVDDVKTNFVHLYVLLSTRDLPVCDRMYLPLLVELIGESPILRDQGLIPYADVIKELSSDTVSTSATLGLEYQRFFCSEYPQMICLSLTVLEEKYQKGIQWIKELLYQTVFDGAKIKSTATKMISDIASLRRDGFQMTKLLMSELSYSSKSNRYCSSMMRQQLFLTQLLEMLDQHSTKIEGTLSNVLKTVSQPHCLTIHMGANIDNLKKQIAHLEQPWENLLPSGMPTEGVSSSNSRPLEQCHALLADFSPDVAEGKIVGLSTNDSSFLLMTSPCINSYKHDDFPALLMLLQYLTQLEGPLWKEIRGLGLAYGYGIRIKPNEGLIYYQLYRSTYLLKAYQETQKIIEAHLNGGTKWNSSLLQSALGSMVFLLINEEKTVDKVITKSIKGYYSEVDKNFTQHLLDRISKVNFAEMERVGKKYLIPLFNPLTSKCSICCHPKDVQEIVKDFKGISKELTILPSLDDSTLTKFEQ